MIVQRFRGDQGTWQGKLVIETNPGDPNSWAELISLRDELALRANVHSEGSIITSPPATPPPPPTD